MGIKSLTFGTALYEIPLPKGWHLNSVFPLEISEYWNGTFVVECPTFEENGWGKSYSEALADLGSSILDFRNSLKRLKVSKNLSEPLRRVNDNFEKHVVKE